ESQAICGPVTWGSDRSERYRTYITVNDRLRRFLGVSLAVFALCGVPPLSAQEPPRSGPKSGFSLEQNYPNPFNPETRIPFVLSPDLFVDGHEPIVTIRIYNILQQV